MGKMFERAFAEQRLLDAWRDAREAALADGEAGAAVEQFEVAAARNISDLATALVDGTFEPQPVMRVEIAKSSGGTRRLAIPSLRDRIVERALLVELDAVVDPVLLPWSFAYRHGPGVKDVIATLTEARDAGYGRTRTGFAGSLTLRLTRDAPPEARGILATLATFVEYSGTGTQVTHGFDATTLTTSK